MQNPLISILTPFKNTEQFLPQCLDSIMKQTYANWELLIVDDGSTDTSYSIVNASAKKDKRIKLFKNPENGIIEALRHAFSQSQGDFITRMDSDDLMHPEKLQTMLNSLLTYGKQHVASGLVTYFSDTSINDGYTRYEAWLNKLTARGTNYSEIYKECVIPSPCWMIHKEDLLACGAFNLNRYPEDYDLTFRFYKHKYSCIPCNKVLHYWRDYNTRTSRTHVHYAQNTFLELKLHYFLELDYNSKRPLTIWGAGDKGKTISKLLIKNKVPFYWICDNSKKIGKDIYNQKLKNFDYLKTLNNPQSIITVANVHAQDEIKAFFKTLNMKPMKDYFFFC